MCRLFGFRSNVPSRTHRSLVEAENALAVQALEHSDGWGIGYFMGNEAYILKSDTGAAKDKRFQKITSRLQSHAFVVHVRRATVGNVDSLNSHPFRYGSWVFAHNGTIFGFDQMRDEIMKDVAEPLQQPIFGDTDSEHLFYLLLSALEDAGIASDGRGEIDVHVATEVLRNALSRLYRIAKRDGHPPPILNFILTNGKVFFAQRAGLELYVATQKFNCRDFEICTEVNKSCMDIADPISTLLEEAPPTAPVRTVNHCLVASEPISEEDQWEEIPEGNLLVMNERMELFVSPAPEDFQKCPHPPAPAPRPPWVNTQPVV